LMATMPWPVRVIPSGAHEPLPPRGAGPGRWTEKLARKKALSVARRTPNALVLGADTLVYRKGRILGKPSSVLSAKRMLNFLSGRWHVVFTGLALIAPAGGRLWSGSWSTRVKMRRLSPEEVAYWSKRNHDKAGAYAIQAAGRPKGKRFGTGIGPFVEMWKGDFDNVMGLPRRGVRELIRKARIAGYRLKTKR
jgi:septum formation protein